MKEKNRGRVLIALLAVVALVSAALVVYAGPKSPALSETLVQANVPEPGGPVLRPTSGPLGYWMFNDFLKDTDLSTTNYTFTVTNSTAPTTVTHAVGGTATFTNAGADNDRIEVDETSETIKLESGKAYRFVFKGKYDCVTASQADIGFGIGIIDTDWLGDSEIMSDGVFFEVNDGDANLDLVTAYNAASTSDYVRSAAIATLTDNTTFTVVMDIVVDANTSNQARILVWVDGSLVHNAVHTGIVQDEELCLKWGIQNGAAEAQVLTVDYIGATGER